MMYLTIVISVILQVFVHSYTVDPDNITDIAEMRKALKDVLEINQRLDWQNRRSMKVWSGLLQMCNDLSLTTDQHQDTNQQEDTLTFQQTIPSEIYIEEPSQSEVTLENQDVNVDATKEANEGPLHIISVTSNSDSYINVTITYIAPEHHSTDWHARLDRNGKLRSAGNRRPIGTTYSVYEVYYEPEIIEELHFRLHSGTRSVHILLDILSLSEPGEKLIPKSPSGVSFQQMKYRSSYKDDIEVVATFEEYMDSDVISAGTHVSLIGINTSSDPFEIFMYSNSDGNAISLMHNVTGNVSSVSINVKAEVAQYGGLLTVRPPSLTTIGGFIHHLYHERYVAIVATSSEEAFKQNTFGLFSTPKQIIVDTEFYSISCSAIGNPVPKVKLLRQHVTGERIEEKVQTVLADNYRTDITHTLSSNDKSDRIYICSATSGDQHIEEEFEVLFPTPVRFNLNNTKVMEEDNDTLVIVCEATGYPLPELDLQINNGTMTPLTSLKTTFEVDRAMAGDMHTLTVTLTKPQFEIPQLDCVAKQSGHGDIVTITVYPKGDRDLPIL